MSVKRSLKVRDLFGYYFIKQGFKPFASYPSSGFSHLILLLLIFFIFLFLYHTFCSRWRSQRIYFLLWLFFLLLIHWPVTMEIVCHHQICCRTSVLSFSFCWSKLLFCKIMIHFLICWCTCLYYFASHSVFLRFYFKIYLRHLMNFFWIFNIS